MIAGLAAAMLLAASPAPHPIHGGYGVHAAEATGGANSGSSSNGAATETNTHVLNTSCEGDGACLPIDCPPGGVPVWHEVLNAKNEDVAPGHMACLGGQQISTAAAVARAFRRIPVPTPALHIQPVKGRTLVNFKTNFYATGGSTFTKTVTLLGHHVTLKIHVQSYDYRFGDGQQLSTTEAGAAYPQLTNTHKYLRKGVVHPSLTTTWTADYKVDNGGWQQVDGTVTTTTPTQRLEVTTARPVLVDPTTSRRLATLGA